MSEAAPGGHRPEAAEAKHGYRFLLNDKFVEESEKDVNLADQAIRQLSSIDKSRGDRAGLLEWHVSDPQAAAKVREIFAEKSKDRRYEDLARVQVFYTEGKK